MGTVAQVAVRYKPSARECVSLFLSAVCERESRNKPTNRLRLAEITLKRLCGRERLTTEFVDEVREWMLSAGWVLVETGKVYGAARREAVEDWPRLGAARSKETLDQVARGEFDFDQLESLWPAGGQSDGEADEEAQKPEPRTKSGK